MKTRLRPFNPETDFTPLLELIAEVEAADQAGSDASEVGLRRQLERPGHDPRRDRWVAEAPDGRLVGHAWIVLRTPYPSYLDGAVHPEFRRQGIGSALLPAAVERLRAAGAVEIVAGTAAADTAGNAFLRARGFTPAGHDRMFDAPAGTPLSAPEFPNGYTLKSLAELDDLELLAAACNQCRGDMWGHMERTQPLTAEWFAERIARFPSYYPPDGTWVLFAPNGDIAGVNFCRLGDPVDPDHPDRREKIIDSPGVAPAHRHLDLQRPLVLLGMQWLAAQAAGPYRLETWGDTDRAVQIYRQLGFGLEPRNHFIEHLLTTPDGSS